MTKNPNGKLRTRSGHICVATRRFFVYQNGRPPNLPPASNINIGKPAAKLTIPSMIALLVSALITQPCAIICIHVPRVGDERTDDVAAKWTMTQNSASDFESNPFYLLVHRKHSSL